MDYFSETRLSNVKDNKGTALTVKDKEGTVSSTTNLKIRKSWSISESPWNNGFFVTISANIHPTLQMSTGQAYL